MCRVWDIHEHLLFACAESGILNYYSNVSQEGEDLFLITLTVSAGVQSLEYSLTFTFYICRVWNTELILQRELGQSLEYSLTIDPLHVQSLEY